MSLISRRGANQDLVGGPIPEEAILLEDFGHLCLCDSGIKRTVNRPFENLLLHVSSDVGFGVSLHEALPPLRG
jgi:hypothetical protein